MRAAQVGIITAWVVGLLFTLGARYYGLDWAWAAFVGLIAMAAVASGVRTPDA